MSLPLIVFKLIIIISILLQFCIIVLHIQPFFQEMVLMWQKVFILKGEFFMVVEELHCKKTYEMSS